MKKDILIVEPFYGGSHRQLIDLLTSDETISSRSEIVTMKARKWHWRARASALYLSQIIPVSADFRVLFSSSVLNLAELVALRPDLATLKKIVYFHENQLIYPVRKRQDRDFQYGYNQILSSMVADINVFNSEFNMKSFLSSIHSHLKLIPSYRPKDLLPIIKPKCRVLYFPIQLSQATTREENADSQCILPNPCDERDNIECINMSEDLRDVTTCKKDLNGKEGQMKCFEQMEETHIPQKHSEDDTAISVSNAENPHNYPKMAAECTLVGDGGDMYTDDSAVVVSHDVLFGGNSDSAYCDGSDELRDNLSGMGNIQHSRGRTSAETDDMEGSSAASADKVQGCVTQRIYTEMNSPSDTCLHIVWPHRWEHDKDPEFFFQVLLQLQREGYDFRLSVIGETFKDVPDIFQTAQSQLADKIVAWGYQRRQDYLQILSSAHVVVSTALHEFFGVSMLEAVSFGCYPLCPNRLVYPEIYPKECLYSTQAQLMKRLRQFCQRPRIVQKDKFKCLAERFSWTHLQENYTSLLLESDSATA